MVVDQSKHENDSQKHDNEKEIREENFNNNQVFIDHMKMLNCPLFMKWNRSNRDNDQFKKENKNLL